MAAIFSAGVEAALPVRDAERRRDRRDRRWPVARQDVQIEAALRAAPALPATASGRSFWRTANTALRSPWANAIIDVAGLESDRRPAASATPQNAATAEPRLDPVDHGAHALPRFLDRAFVWRPVARLSRHRRSQRMAARQREPRGLFEHVRVEHRRH